MKKRKTNEKFLEEVFNLVGDEYTVLEKYELALKKIKFRHNNCNHEFMMTPHDFLRGRRCLKCSGVYRRNHEEFVQDVINIRGDIYDFITEYTNNKTKIKVRHKECGYIWDILPSSLLSLRKKGKTICPNCNGGVTYNLKKFKKMVYDLEGDEYLVIGNYVNAHTKIDIMHNKCGTIYTVNPANFLNGNRCSMCFGNLKKTTEQFKKEVFELVENEYEVIGEYINNKTKLKMRHGLCGYISEITPDGFLNHEIRCLYCKKSRGELSIKVWLDKNNIDYSQQYSFNDCKDTKLLRFDFAIFDNSNNIRCLIEYDGIGHFKEINYFGGKDGLLIQQKHDRIKNKYCHENGINLFRIPYWKSKDIEEILNKIIHKEFVKIDENFIIKN